jgi:hypothetical protein
MFKVEIGSRLKSEKDSFKRLSNKKCYEDILLMLANVQG